MSSLTYVRTGSTLSPQQQARVLLRESSSHVVDAQGLSMVVSVKVTPRVRVSARQGRHILNVRLHSSRALGRALGLASDCFRVACIVLESYPLDICILPSTVVLLTWSSALPSHLDGLAKPRPCMVYLASNTLAAERDVEA